MKTTIFTLAAIAVLALGTVNLSEAATKKVVSTIVSEAAAKINKIEVHGNVELYVSDGSQDRVKVYNNYYAENALVQNHNGVLRISSYQKEKLVIWVTASDLQAITAYDNADVKSFGKLAEIGLDVNLYNNASAKLDLNGYSANINLYDRTKADLTGTVSECELKHERSTTLNKTNFVAANLTDVRKNEKAVHNNEGQELAGL